MKKFLDTCVYFLIISCPLFSQEYPKVLDDFIRSFLIDSEPGYVLFGSKPICYFAIPSKTNALITSTNHELESKLRMGIEWWIKAQPQQTTDDYVFKVSAHDSVHEILCLNKKKVLEAIQENLTLFQYILGHKLTPETLYKKLATNPEPFYKMLKHNKTLVGILLGFGTTNSLLGARSEDLANMYYEVLEPPHVRYHESDSYEREWNILELCVLFDQTCSPKEKIEIGFDFTSVQEEKEYLLKHTKWHNHYLQAYSPRLIYHDFDNYSASSEKYKTFEEEQKQIIELISSEDLTERVLKRLNIKFTQPNYTIEEQPISAYDIAGLIHEHVKQIRQIESLEGTLEAIEDSTSQHLRYQKPDYAEYYELWVLNTFQDRVKFAEEFFTQLSKDSNYLSLDRGLFFRTIEKGNGDTLTNNVSKGTFSYSIFFPEKASSIPNTAHSNVELDLNKVIPGLAWGVEGMKIGELREIYIHPDWGYGLYTNFEKWQPLRVMIRLEKLENNSPPLVFLPKPLPPDRLLRLTPERINRLQEIAKVFAYYETKIIMDFYHHAAPAQEVAEELKKIWNQSEIHFNLMAVDQYSLKLWAKKQEEENDRAVKFFNQLTDAIPLQPNKLYLKYHSKGNRLQTAYWPRKITLKFKDLNEKVLKKAHYENLTLNQFCRWNQGLQMGLRNCRKGDKGCLFIHPELSDPGLFRNHLAHKALIVDFEVL